MSLPRHDLRSPLAWICAAVLVTGLGGCDREPGRETAEPAPTASTPRTPADAGTPAPSAAADPGPVTLGFAGDIHFEDDLAALLRRRGPALDRSVAAALRRPDLMMVNLETTLTERGRPERKEFTFRSSPRALDLLDAWGVDVVSLANNHAVDYGLVGLRDTLAAVRDSPVPVIGIGKDADAAFRARTFSIRGTTHRRRGGERPGRAHGAVLVRRSRQAGRGGGAPGRGDSSRRYAATPTAPTWSSPTCTGARSTAAAPTPSRCAMRGPSPRRGPTWSSAATRTSCSGSGWREDAYVGYGLGNFLWYNQNSVDTGILELTIRGGDVVADSFRPARIRADGRPRLLDGRPRTAAITRWQRLRGCAGLAARPAPASRAHLPGSRSAAGRREVLVVLGVDPRAAPLPADPREGPDDRVVAADDAPAAGRVRRAVHVGVPASLLR